MNENEGDFEALGYAPRERKYSEVIRDPIPSFERTPSGKNLSSYTKVFETDDPQIIEYYEDHPVCHLERSKLISTVSSPQLFRPSANMDEPPPINISRRLRIWLVVLTSTLFVLSACLVAVHVLGMGDLDMRIVILEKASFDGHGNAGILQLSFLMDVDNANIQHVELKEVFVDLSLENGTGLLGTPLTQIKVGPIHHFTGIRIDGTHHTSFLMESRFNTENITRNALVLDVLRFGRFSAKMNGHIRFNTMHVFHIESDIAAETYVERPVLL